MYLLGLGRGGGLADLAPTVQKVSGNILTLVFCWSLLPSEVAWQKGLDMATSKSLLPSQILPAPSHVVLLWCLCQFCYWKLFLPSLKA